MTHITRIRKPSEIKITFVEPYATLDGKLFSPVAKDVYSLAKLPARAVDLLAAVCREAGYTDTASITLQYAPEHTWQRLGASDVVGISAITRTAQPAYELARLVRLTNPQAIIVFGGPHVTALPEEALAHGDLVVRHEGDRTILDVLERVRLDPGAPDWRGLAGAAYRDGERVVVEPARAFLTSEELNELPFPTFPKEVEKSISHHVMITSRGCPHGCRFCSVIENFGRRHRFLEVDRMFAYYRHLVTQSRKDIFIGDDNFAANPARVKAFCERILASDLPRVKWYVQVRVEAAGDMEMLGLMREAGCDTVMVGLESVNDKTLALWNKHSSLDKNTWAVKRFHEARIGVHGMFVLGSDVDDWETVRQTIDFAKRLNLASAQFFPLTPLPGTPLTREYEEQGRVLTHDWRLYDGHHVLVESAAISSADLQRAIALAHQEFYSWSEGLRHLFLTGSHQRLYNCVVRFAGSRLTRRICAEAKPHLNELGRLERWRADFHEIYGKLSASMSRLTGSVSGDMAQSKKVILEALEQGVGRLSEAAHALRQEYQPYCDRLLDSLSAALNRDMEQLLLEAPA